MYVLEPDVAVFVGPTASGAPTQLAVRHPRVRLYPPVARGDLLELPNSCRIVLIVDGYFGSRPSVSHLELLQTLQSRKVFGCSSMGAIRAFELRNEGMTGLGRVYKKFFEFEDFMDDEVALLHAPEPHYWPMSIPLVNVRFALSELGHQGACSPVVATEVIARLKDRYFGDRTQDLIIATATEIGGESFAHNLRSRLSGIDVKQSDFVESLAYILTNETTDAGG